MDLNGEARAGNFGKRAFRSAQKLISEASWIWSETLIKDSDKYKVGHVLLTGVLKIAVNAVATAANYRGFSGVRRRLCVKTRFPLML